MTWTTPAHVSSGTSSSSQFNAETVDNLQHLHDTLEGSLTTQESSGSSGTLTTSFAAIGASVTLGAGEWILIAKGNWNHSSSGSARTFQAELHDGTTQLDLSEYISAVANAKCPFVLLDHYTAAGSTTITVRGKVSATGGSQVAQNVHLVAIPRT